MRKGPLLMAEKTEITQKNFELLLDWLDKDRDVAARKYDSIYRRLVQIFWARKAFPAEELADQTIDIVLSKIDYLVKEYKGDPSLYFYNVAHKIFQEFLRKPKSESLSEHIIQKETEEEKNTPYIKCLKECLRALPREERDVFIKYFKYEKRSKIRSHKKMAQKMGIDIKVLRVKIWRLKESLETCIKNCVQKKIS